MAVAAALLALAIAGASAPWESPAVDARIRESAAAAQALQGPLDGAWRLTDDRGRLLRVFAVSDPAGGGVPEAAWRDPAGRAGFVDAVDRSGAALTLRWREDDGPATLHLVRVGRGRWRGCLHAGGLTRAVALAR